MSLSEFSIIERFFADPARQTERPDVLLGIGDDCALLQPPAGKALAVSIDTLVEGVHFPRNMEAHAIGHRALAVNLSDLAAMGAEPAWFTLALTLPESDEDWLAGFSRGLFDLAKQSNIALVGGNIARGPLSISIEVHGFVAAEKALRRDGARCGDAIFVSGWPGEAAAGLAALQANRSGCDDLVLRFKYPQPRLALGQSLLGLAHAAIDLSDGLLADLGHILERSRVGARIDLENLPLSPALLTACGSDQAARFALSGGDDYELCFSAPADCKAAIADIASVLELPLTCIGEICAGPGLRDARGQPLDPRKSGFKHFSQEAD